jgi:TPP-dependent pyruvate/acetoin dehydrogenase alpha subunit
MSTGPSQTKQQDMEALEPHDLGEQLLKRMVRIRLIEEAIADRYTQQQMRCPVHLSIGQEAVAAGVCAALRLTDQVMSSHRSHAHFLAKGGNLKAMIAELYGKETGCCHGRGGSMHLIDPPAGFMGAVPIVGSTIPIAVGLAFANRLQSIDRVAVAFFGEGATEEGVFHESANFASLHKLPMIFACENNLYSVYSPMSVRQPAHREVYRQALGHGIKAFQIDGNNAMAVYRAAREAVSNARSGAGPVFIEFLTYRWREHCGPNWDNNIGYRTEAEFLEWKKRDPILVLENILRSQNAYDERGNSAFCDLVQKEIAEAFGAAENAAFPKPETLLDHVFAA